MKRSLGLALAASTVAALVAASPASAQRASVEDEAGDAGRHGLDITRVSVRNLDDAVVTKVEFTRSVRGDLVVSIDPRGGRGLRLVTKYDPAGHISSAVLTKAFTDRGGRGEQVRCPGFRVRWSIEEPTATVRLPSSCLAGGDYGAIRFAVLTESAHGADADAAPEDASSGWVARG